MRSHVAGQYRRNNLLGFKRMKHVKEIYPLYSSNRRSVVPERLFYNPEVERHQEPVSDFRKLVNLSPVGQAGIFKKGKRINILA